MSIGGVYEVSKCCPQESIIDLCRAFDNYFRKIKSGEIELGKKAKYSEIMNSGRSEEDKVKAIRRLKDYGRPDKRYKWRDDSCRFSVFEIEGKKISLPRMSRKRSKKSWIRMAEAVRFNSKEYLSVTISLGAGCWYVSIQCVIDDISGLSKPVLNKDAVGIDVGTKEYVCSDGMRYSVPRSYRQI